MYGIAPAWDQPSTKAFKLDFLPVEIKGVVEVTKELEEAAANNDADEEEKEMKVQILLPGVELEADDASPEATRMSMKFFKMIFNRALRIKSRSTPRGECMFRYLDKKLEKMLGSPNTYYQSGICLELVRTENR